MATKKPAKKCKAGNGKSAAANRKLKFIDAYIENGGNATQAAISAGFSKKTGYSIGARLLKNVEVLAEITKRTKELSQKFELTTERTLREIARLAYSDPRKFYDAEGNLRPIHELDDDTAACIASVEVDEITMEHTVIGHTKKLKQWDKNSALEKAMKFHGLYEKDNAQQQPVEIVIRF